MSWTFQAGHDVGDDMDTYDMKVDVVAVQILNMVPASERPSVLRALEHAYDDLVKVGGDELHFLNGKHADGRKLTLTLGFIQQGDDDLWKEPFVKGRIDCLGGIHVLHGNAIYLRDIPVTIAESMVGKKVSEVANIPELSERTIIEVREMSKEVLNTTVHKAVLNPEEPQPWEEALKDWATVF